MKSATLFSRRPAPAVLSGLFLLLLGAAGSGCQQSGVTHFRVPKEAPAGPPTGHSTGNPPPGMNGQVPPPPVPTGEAALKWTLPQGWTEEKAGGMRFATIRPSVPGKVEVSVIVLPGTAGGELANVNRWRGQIGLPPVDEGALQASRKQVKSRAGMVSVFDFTSEGSAKTRVVAGLLTAADGNTWFLKMNGDADPVGKSKPGFLQLMESLRLD